MSGRIIEWLEGQHVYEQIEFIDNYEFDRNDFYKKLEISISGSLVYFVKLFNEESYLHISFPAEYSRRYSIDNENANNNPIYATLKFLDRTVSDQYISKLETYEFMSKYKYKYNDYIGIEDGWLHELKSLLISYNHLSENSTRFVLDLIRSHWCTNKNGMSREESEEIRLDEKYRIINDAASSDYVPENGTPSKGKGAAYSLTNDSIRASIKDALGDQLSEDDINRIIDGFKPMKIEDDSDIILEKVRSFKEELEPIYTEVNGELDYERSKEFMLFYSNHSVRETAERFGISIETVYFNKNKIMKKYPELIDLIDLYDEKEDEESKPEESKEDKKSRKDRILEFVEFSLNHTLKEVAKEFNISYSAASSRRLYYKKHYPELFEK